MQILKGHKDRVWQLAFNFDGSLLASCSGDKCIFIWKCINEKYELQQILDNAHSKTVRCISFSPDGRFLASGSFDSLITIWIYDNGKFKNVQQLEGHESEIKSVHWSYDSKYLASCSRDKTVWIWDHSELEFQCNFILQAHTQDIKFVKWAKNSYDLYSCGYDNMIIKYSYQDDEWDQTNTLEDHESTVWCIDLFQDYMISVSQDESIKVYYKNTLTQTLKEYHDQPIYYCSFNHDGTMFATAGGDNKINIFEILDKDETGVNKYQLKTKISTHQYDVNCVIFHPKKNTIASCSDDECICIQCI